MGKTERTRYAPFKDRLIAFLYDYLFIALYAILVVGSISFLLRRHLEPYFSGSPAVAQSAGFLMLTLPVALYFIFSESSVWQGTWGKRIMGLRVVDGRGKRIAIYRSIIRTAVKLLPWEMAHFGVWRLYLPSDYPENILLAVLSAANVLAVLYFLTPMLNGKRQSIYDMAAGTLVVRTKGGSVSAQNR